MHVILGIKAVYEFKPVSLGLYISWMYLLAFNFVI